jgi:hypothetical protein
MHGYNMMIYNTEYMYLVKVMDHNHKYLENIKDNFIEMIKVYQA